MLKVENAYKCFSSNRLADVDKNKFSIQFIWHIGLLGNRQESLSTKSNYFLCLKNLEVVLFRSHIRYSLQMYIFSRKDEHRYTASIMRKRKLTTVTGNGKDRNRNQHNDTESNLVIQIIKKDNEIMEWHDTHLKSIASWRTPALFASLLIYFLLPVHDFWEMNKCREIKINF